MNWFSRAMLVFAGFLGAGGVLAAAAASHSGSERIMGAVALIALTQAPALLAFGLLSPAGALLRAGGLLVAFGASLFTAVLVAGNLLDGATIPVLAPAGGSAMVLGWIMVAVAGITGRR